MDACRFPMFINLAGKPVVVVGAGTVGMRRAGVLADFGAKVTVIDPRIREFDRGECVSRPYETGDLQGFFLAVAATSSREVNHRVYEEAKRLGIPISVSDCPEECTFYFPAIARTERLVAGLVSTDGDHKNTAQTVKKIRTFLEEMS